MKVCSTCESVLPTTEYTKDGRRPDGLHTQCKTCKRESQRAYRETNRVAARKASADWNKANPERVAAARANFRARQWGITGEITAADISAVYRDYGYACLRCKRTQSVRMDHVTPLSKGGTNSRDNLQPLCDDCNSRKRAEVEDYR